MAPQAQHTMMEGPTEETKRIRCTMTPGDAKETNIVYDTARRAHKYRFTYVYMYRCRDL